MRHRGSQPRSFYVCIRQTDVVGPHDLDVLRQCLINGAISRDTQVCPEGEQTWTQFENIPKFDFVPARLRERLENQNVRSWQSQPATENQIAKLKYFEIPFDENDLSKAHASELIDCFMRLDPVREEQYQTRSATPEQLAILRSQGVETLDLNYSEARSIIDDAKSKQQLIEIEQRSQATDRETDLMLLDSTLNDEDTFELCHYQHLNNVQLEQMLDYLNGNVPNWRDKDRFTLGDYVARNIVSQRVQSKPTNSFNPFGDVMHFIALVALLAIAGLILYAAIRAW